MFVDVRWVFPAVHLPLFIDVSSFSVLVVGCGSVGLRRAELFRRYGARVTVVCRDGGQRISGAEPRSIDVRSLDSEALKDLLKPYDIVVVAVDDESLAKSIALAALSLKKLVNNAVDYRFGNTVVPLKLSLNGVDIGLTSYGLSVELLRRIAQKISTSLAQNTEIKTLYRVSRVLKRCIKKTTPLPKLRIELYRRIYSDTEFNNYIEKGDEAGAILRAVDIAREMNTDLEPCISSGG
ncbi:MAG: bifunctional precorrin-2 dehydrogenase/sirohydrochlorin ferrochelatase [Ignisphaera sp.]|nr:bifunctional precorrin-2 dehydrogenase/sirohydrochlorin ferrochelatase [Ignisphaera sp.]MDW8086152.1 bifunctional precorrin-2 dehydrogenase/sirohydrochlorin ferrochelatase [Ignisphaera sp.]